MRASELGVGLGVSRGGVVVLGKVVPGSLADRPGTRDN